MQWHLFIFLAHISPTISFVFKMIGDVVNIPILSFNAAPQWSKQHPRDKDAARARTMAMTKARTSARVRTRARTEIGRTRRRKDPDWSNKDPDWSNKGKDKRKGKDERKGKNLQQDATKSQSTQ